MSPLRTSREARRVMGYGRVAVASTANSRPAARARTARSRAWAASYDTGLSAMTSRPASRAATAKG